jgi:hypothetical protein
MKTIVAIVEGHGEVEALRTLLEKLIDYERYGPVDIPRPMRAPGSAGAGRDLTRLLEAARSKKPCDGVLVLLDADEKCPKDWAPGLTEQARNLALPFPVVIVCAKCEYETWFLASLETIAGQEGTDIPAGVTYPHLKNVEERRGAKEWLSGQMPGERSYRETRHQSRMTQYLDPNLARQHSRSFRRLEHALKELLEANEPIVTPRHPGQAM